MLIQKVRSAIRARFFSPDITLRQQGRIVDASHQSMMRLNKRCDELMMDYPTIESLSDTELVNKLYPAVLQPTRSKRQPDIDTILEEFTKPRKKRKSRTMLYLEYVAQNPETALSRTQFFRTVRKALRRSKITMRQLHVAGEVIYIDYAGTRAFYFKNGKKISVKIFVAVLGASQKIFAWATLGEKTIHWIDGMTRMFDYFGGTTEVVSMDNAKALVSKPGVIADLNLNIEAFGEFYSLIIDTCRVGRPQDKALVELMVKFITQRIIVPKLHTQKFFSLEELNDYLAKDVEKLNDLPFQGTNTSRNDLFKLNEQQALKPLPKKSFSMLVAKEKTRVMTNYHIRYKGGKYSVPYTLNGEMVDVVADQTSLRIIHDNREVARHKLLEQGEKYSTDESHMPADHLADKRNNSQPENVAWAKSAGRDIDALVKYWYSDTINPSSRAIGKRCLKLKSLVEKYGAEVVNKACEYATAHDMQTPDGLSLIISAQAHENGFENLPTFNLAHQNVRGKEYYGGRHEA
jgi:transposase